MVLGISLAGPVRVLTKHVCRHGLELRTLGLFGVLGLRELDGSGQAALLESFINTENQIATWDCPDTLIPRFKGALKELEYRRH